MCQWIPKYGYLIMQVYMNKEKNKKEDNKKIIT